MSGKLFLVSVGPGFASLVPEMAREALSQSDAIVGYELYLRWIQPWIAGKETFSPPMRHERERVKTAMELARAGRTVSLVSSGDIGIYAMAALVFEDLGDQEPFEVKVIPGVSAANACAALLGSPLSHDYATLSLSDLLCPWDWIERRASHIAQADLCCVFYNVQSKDRQEGVYRILDLMLEHKRPETVCGVVRNAYREDQEITITTLAGLKGMQFDMLTSLVIGNRFTQQKGGWMYTPRGYNDWTVSGQPRPDAKAPDGAVWVFAGTADGNALARQIVAAGHTVVISAASELGGDIAARDVPGATIWQGQPGMEARRLALKNAAAIVDATHPYAVNITNQLVKLGQELGVPYLRFERPPTIAAGQGVEIVAGISEAVYAAAQHGERIFLATGAKELSEWTGAEGANELEFFARVALMPESLAAAERAGIPRRNVVAMVGPFSREMNVAQWREWKIDVVVTKDSGEAGGAQAKLEAARELGIPLIVLARPESAAATTVTRPEDALAWLATEKKA